MRMPTKCECGQPLQSRIAADGKGLEVNGIFATWQFFSDCWRPKMHIHSRVGGWDFPSWFGNAICPCASNRSVE